MSGSAPPLRSTSCAVFRDGRLLVIRRSEAAEFHPGLWDTPGGLVEPGESYRDGALRELREETGLIGSDMRLLGTSAFTNPFRPRQQVRERSYLVECSIEAPVMLDPYEHCEYRWIETEDLECLPTWERRRAGIGRAFRLRLRIPGDFDLQPQPASARSRRGIR